MKKNLVALLLTVVSLAGVVGCSNKTDKTGTAKAVEEASKMTLKELEDASKKEMEGSKDNFTVLGLTSTLKKAVTTFAAKYDWIKYDENDKTKSNTYVNNGYKDYTLLQALEQAETNFVGDFALVQDERSIADYVDGGILHNYIPSDVKELGLSEGTMPLRGIHFNKIFWTNTNFEKVTGKRLYNIWQMAGTDADADHLAKVSFQSPTTEQINMSFLLSCEDPAVQPQIEAAYKEYYKKDWACPEGKDYVNCGTQWVTEFIANVSRWHSSDGTAMKETQLKDDWNEGYVYYGAFAKMKDAAGKKYDIDLNGDGTTADDEKNINAMTTVKWDWDVKGFDGFMYTMDSQIINNARHPYTACLYARHLLLPETYVNFCHNASTPNKAGEASNMYGYYYPGDKTTATVDGKEVKIENDNDRTKAIWKEVSINEKYEYLSKVKSGQVNSILAMCASNKKAK